MSEEQFKELVGIAIGEASMCWSDVPQGVFESERALKIFERIIEASKKLKPDPQGPREGE